MRILVATDGSAPAAVGMRLVAGIAWPDGSTVRVVTAVDSGTALFGGPWPSAMLLQVGDVEAALKAAATRTVAEATMPLARPGLTVETGVLEGRPASAIAEEADRIRADLIVLGARGHGAIESMLLGSVSAEVLDSAHVPVLVARAPQIARILLAWDGSPGAERAATILSTWPIFRTSMVRVVSVSETPTPWWAGSDPAAPELIPLIVDAMDSAREERRRLTTEMTARLRAAGLVADDEAREGAAAEEILASAADWGAELILMGTRGRTGLSRLALGSVARNVVHHASCSVLVVRGSTAAGAQPRP
jgi:nucleotide-binding universal stress UspA family protein